MTFYVSIIQGLGDIVIGELKNKLENVKIVTTHRTRNHELIFFETSSLPVNFKKLRTVEDVFLLLEKYKLTKNDQDLKSFKKRGLAMDKIAHSLSIKKQILPIKKSFKHTFRVVVQATSEYSYNRSDAKVVFEKLLMMSLPNNFRLQGDIADTEYWLNMFENEAVFGLRLTDHTTRHRGYKEMHLPASLRPSLAASMVIAADIWPDDIFVDPMCGAGTIVIERLLAGEFEKIIAGDISIEAVTATEDNLNNIPKNDNNKSKIRLSQWDATKLGLPDKYVTKVVTNLPFGKQIGSVESNHKLYAGFLKEAARILQDRGKMVVLTSEVDLFSSLLTGFPQFCTVKKMSKINILGQRACIFICINNLENKMLKTNINEKFEQK